MEFSSQSDISIVVTSCGRFDLLKRTLDSLNRYVDLPIREVFITEDSGLDNVRECLPESWAGHVTLFINNPKLGQLASIDLAYSHVKTKYVFHCEDDWEFYRSGFMSDSRAILEKDENILQVWLRSYAHDLLVHSPYHYLGERLETAGVHYYPILSNKSEWQGFSLNPGLRRLADYLKVAPFAGFSGEKALSMEYAGQGFIGVLLEADAVLHTGFEAHVVSPKDRLRKEKRRFRERLRMWLVGILGVLLGLGIGFIVGPYI